MKNFIISFLLLLLSLQIQSQNAGLDDKIRTLKTHIEKAENGEKLKWLDSLSTLTLKNVDYDYNPIAHETIELASTLDAQEI